MTIERDEPWHHKVDMCLTLAASAKRTLTYDALATEADIPAPHRIHKLTTFLETLICEDVASGRPIRAALVISKVRGRPAPGFFDCCRAQQLEIDDEGAFHQRQLDALFTPSQS